MFCRKCGKELPEESEFCQYCGSKIETSTIEFDDNKAEVKEEPITEEVIIPTVDSETVVGYVGSQSVLGWADMMNCTGVFLDGISMSSVTHII